MNFDEDLLPERLQPDSGSANIHSSIFSDHTLSKLVIINECAVYFLGVYYN